MTRTVTQHAWPAVTGNVAIAVCRDTPAGPCVAEIGLELLAQLYLSGVRQIRSPGCTCGRAEAEAWPADVMDRMGMILASRSLAPMGWRSIRLTPAVRAALDEVDEGVSLGRRGFLRGLAGTPPALANSTASAPALPRLLAICTDAPGALFAVSPVIAASRCTGCDGCVRICPEGALTLVNAGAGDLRYKAAAESCNGCALCLGPCDADAIELREMAPKAAPVRLSEGHCRACGVAIHEPAMRGPIDDLCRICRVTGHHRKLFQVLT